ncbi:MAG: DUF1993 family protein [Sphingomonadales bacterium]|nr:DUF1993 family protein [Sphingomonadales bacterium]MBD3774408.1 DUF1993 family protein [Paracoccaceae bacterium]
MSYSQDACATFSNMLGTLDHLAGKAEQAALGDDILAAKLAEDMFPLETQFRIAINQVILALVRTCGIEMPLDETPYGSLGEVRERLGALRKLVEDAGQRGWIAVESEVDFTLPNAMRFVMSAGDYLRDWTLPNFYFHTAMAYALLRRDGLQIGKADFLPHMMRYARAPES